MRKLYRKILVFLIVASILLCKFSIPIVSDALENASIKTGNYTLKNSYSGKNLNVLNGNSSNGTNINIYKENGQDSQSFKIY